MKEKLTELIETLKEKRDGIIKAYMNALELYDADRPDVTLEAVRKAALIHDIDRHISNLYAEIQRVEVIVNA